MKVILHQEDIVRYGGEKHVGIGIYEYDESFDLSNEEAFDGFLAAGESIERVYGPSEYAAMHNAKLECEQKNYEIVLS